MLPFSFGAAAAWGMAIMLCCAVCDCCRGEPYDLRVRRYFPRVKDFERDEKGDIVWGSVRGPERIEARQQLARERMVAGAELKVLQDRLRWCYFKEGVNHIENCKDLAVEVATRLRAPYYGMKGAPSTEW